MIEEAAIGSLTIRQSKLSKSWRPRRSYDLVLTSLSWEERLTAAISDVADIIGTPIVIKFKSSSEAVESEKNRQLKRLESIIGALSPVEFSRSTDVAANFPRLETMIRDLYVQLGRPLNILLDITCFPKTYLLFLIGLGFSRDYFANCDCIYAAGHYDLATEKDEERLIGGPRSLVSEGEWRSHQIPYMTSTEFLPEQRDLVVALGGELGLSLPFIERVEPRRLRLMFIAETAPRPDLPMLTSEKSALDDLMNEPNAERIDVGLGDVIRAARAASEFARAAGSAGVVGMAIGSKTHALGLGIASLSAANMEIICRTPASYRPINVRSTGKHYVYEIQDRFDPSSYF